LEIRTFWVNRTITSNPKRSKLLMWTFKVPFEKVRSSPHEYLMTYCTMCQKVHPTPSSCVSDCMPNVHLTLNSTWMFEPRLANIFQLANQMILIHLRPFPYKYPHPFPYFVYSDPWSWLSRVSSFRCEGNLSCWAGNTLTLNMFFYSYYAVKLSL
jgi:hypothetical protein